jgi:hypothetical protein
VGEGAAGSATLTRLAALGTLSRGAGEGLNSHLLDHSALHRDIRGMSGIAENRATTTTTVAGGAVGGCAR